MGGHLLSLCSAAHASRIKRFTANLPFSIRRYNEGKKANKRGHGVVERAPSTAEEFKRVAEEKSRQGFGSQTVEKAEDAAEEATVGHSTFEPVKEAYKEEPFAGRGSLHKTGDQQ